MERMRLMNKLLLRSVLLVIVLSVFSLQAIAVTFDSNAVVGDRRVELFWTPDEDDPVFTGNLKMFQMDDVSVSDHSLSDPVFTNSGSVVWAWDDVVGSFVKVEMVDEEWSITEVLPAPPVGVEVTCSAVHPLGILLLVGSADGHLYSYRPEGESVSWLEHDAHVGACTDCAFLPLATANDSTFISAGADGYWRKWSRPGEAALNASDQPFDGVGLSSVEITRAGSKVVVGAVDGQLSVYGIAGATQSVVISGEEHGGREITDIIISEDGRRFASADGNGHLRIWNVIGGSLVGRYDPEVESPIFISYTPGASDYIGYAHANGTFGIINGYTCIPYDIIREFGRPITGFSLYVSGLKGFFLDAAGKIELWYQGECIPSLDTPQCFGGYTIWRQTYADTPMVKLRVFNYSDTTWGWQSDNPVRSFVDPDSIIPYGGDPDRDVAGPHNGVPYYYSLTKYYWHFRDGGRFEVYRTADGTEEAIRAGTYGADLPSQPYVSIYDGYYRSDNAITATPLVPRVEAVTEQPVLDRVFVVPNPYQGDQRDSQFDASSPAAIKFFNLPVQATIRIFTSSGDLVRTLNHPQQGTSTSGGECRWDLHNADGKKVASGVYLYSIELKGGQSSRGFFTIIH